MKKFSFRFEPLLKMKMDREEAVANELAEIVKQLRDVNLRIDSIEDKTSRFQVEFMKRKETGLTALELQQGNEMAEYYRRTRNDLLRNRQEVEMRRDDKKHELSEAMKERKIMEKLKEQAFQAYVEEYERNERKGIEEIVTYRGSKPKEAE